MNHEHIHWLGHASFRIESGAMQLYIDPWKLSPASPKADVILITHSHYDHFSPDDIATIKKKETILLIPKDLEGMIDGNIHPVLPGQLYTLGDFTVRTVPAYNIGRKFHPKENQWVGYIITMKDGVRIYHAGDTDNTPEMRTVATDIALLPCGGTYTLTAREAADAANAFKPALVIPMHWGDIVGSLEDAETVKSYFKGETVIKAPEH